MNRNVYPGLIFSLSRFIYKKQLFAVKLDTTKTEAETHISIPTLEVRQNGNILYQNERHAMLNRMLNVINHGNIP